MQAPPRHLGLPRRQSYDPLSAPISGKAKLSLGTLPPPRFDGLPQGQRSVPAVEFTRLHLAGGRSGALTSAAEPRTPGGSLIVGAEVFGFGVGVGRLGKERWGSGKSDAGASEDGGRDANDWPEQFEAPALAAAAALEAQQANGLPTSTIRARHGVDSMSADFSSATARPSLQSYGSTNSLRGTSAMATTAPRKPASAEIPIPSPPPPVPPQDALTPNSESSTPSGAGFYPYQVSPPYPLNGGGADELAFGLGAMSLSPPGGDAAFRAQQPAPPTRQQSGYITARDVEQRQPVPSPYSAYYGVPQNPGYLPQGYAATPAEFFVASQQQQQSDLAGGVQRPSIGGVGAGAGGYTPPSPYQQHRPLFGTFPTGDFSNGSRTPAPSSRHGSFSYNPAGLPFPYSAGIGASTFEGGFVPPPQLTNQQQQIILGRGLRSNVEYIAPGPSAAGGALGYGGFYPSPPLYAGNGGGGGGAGRGEGGGGGGRGSYEDRIVRSPLLEEFRSSRQRDWALYELRGHIVEFSGDQLGSRHIQTKLESATLEEKAFVFDEILPNMIQLSTDVFANYVVQKFFEQGNQTQREELATVLEGNVLALSLQMYGCRVVQKALEHVLVEQQVRLVKELDGHVLKCARDAQSNHVVQRALERVPSNEITFITDACIGQVHALATHPYGCRVLQRIFENCPPPQTRELLDELHRYTQTLIQDQYGNYVVQWVVEKGDRADKALVISRVHGQVLPLAQQKFASNVIEKCIVNATDEERRRLIAEVLSGTGLPGTSGEGVGGTVRAMLVHPYANYVMQKILHTAVGAQREQLFIQTAAQLAHLRKFPTSYSKHLIAIEKLLNSERARNPY